MSRFRDAVGRLADRTEKEIAVLFARYERGEIDQASFVALGAQALARARARGVSLADLALTSAMMRQLREVAPPLGLTPPDNDLERLETSLTTVLSERPDYVGDSNQLRESQKARLSRLSRDSSAEVVAWAFREAMLERKVAGWVRETDRNPCIVCSNLADGVVRSPEVVMKRHTGCCCVQRAVFT